MDKSRLSAIGYRLDGRLSGDGRLSASGYRLSGCTIAELVVEIATRLSSNGDIEDSLREAQDLIAALLDVPRHWALSHENELADRALADAARAAAERRMRGAPLAYAVGRANFRHLTLEVDERVLIPRPETELLVDLVLQRRAGREGGLAVDVGTGSGAIAIALATEGQFERVIATDISSDALEVARGNAERIGAAVDFLPGSLLKALDVRRTKYDVQRTQPILRSTSDVVRQTSYAVPLDVVVSNLPYISFDEARTLPGSVRDWEPALALFSAGNGLSLTAQLVRQAAGRLAPCGLLALEVDARRASLVAELVATDGRYENVTVQLDLAGRERFVLATRGEQR